MAGQRTALVLIGAGLLTGAAIVGVVAYRAANAEPELRGITYEVTTTAPGATATVGDPPDVETYAVPTTGTVAIAARVPVGRENTAMTLVVKASDAGGDVACRLRVGSRVISEAQASGPGAVARCPAR